MKVLLLSDINSPHTQKWASALKQKGVETGIFSLTSLRLNSTWDTSDIFIFYSSSKKNIIHKESSWSKIGYLKYVPSLRNAIKTFSPDIVHAHYISSYGLLSVLSHFQPLVLSAWGSDVMFFPKKSVLHKNVIQFVLKKGASICATSQALKKELSNYTHKKIHVIPFGIDTTIFKPMAIKKNDVFTVYTAKSLEKIYNIDITIKAMAALHQKYPQQPMQLLIAGDGSQRNYLEELAKNLNMEPFVVFKGWCTTNEMPVIINNADILVNVSQYESFGVSVLEASSCEKCVIATNTGGLTEVVEHEKTGFLIEMDNIQENLFNTLEYALLHPDICQLLGKNGRQKVLSEYDLQVCANNYLDVYTDIIQKN